MIDKKALITHLEADKPLSVVYWDSGIRAFVSRRVVGVNGDIAILANDFETVEGNDGE